MTNNDMSPQIGKLAEALAKAQSQMEHAKKDANNPFFKSKYADLTSVSEACRTQLAMNNIAVTQTTTMNEGGHAILVTTLMHSSGEWIRGFMPILASKQDAQGFGSALSYARRYALAGIASVCTSDDDGEAAVGRGTSSPKVAPMPDKISKEQLDQLSAVFHTRWPETAERNKMITTTCSSQGVKSLADLTQEQWQKIMNRLTASQQEKTA